MRKILLTCISLCALHSAFAQKDTEFWFAVPEVSQSPTYILDREIKLRIISYQNAATVTISQPAGGGMATQSIYVPANSSETVNLSDNIDVLECKPADATLNYGLKITSTQPIGAYYEVISGGNGSMPANNPEAFVLKGKNALGTSFLIPSQNLLDNYSNPNYFPTPYNSFDIVATQNNTTVTITPSHDVTGHPASAGSYTVTLGAGQCYSATATSMLASQHLGGSKVQSDKPVAITVKDDLLSGGPVFGGNCADLAGDQIVPMTLLGTEYIAIKGELSAPGDYVFITATQNGTTVLRDGASTPIATLNAGEVFNFPIGNASTYIKTSAPAAVWQVSGNNCEVAATILPQITNTGSDSVAFVRTFNSALKVNLLTPKGNEDDFFINGNPVSTSSFLPVPGTNGAWLAARLDMPLANYPQGSRILVRNTTADFHIGVLEINGLGGGGASYAYFSDYRKETPVVGIYDPNMQDEVISNLYPNPAHNLIKLRFKKPDQLAGTKLGMVIYSVDGRRVVTEETKIPESGLFQYSVEDLPPGTYFCQITYEGGKLTRKFVKL